MLSEVLSLSKTVEIRACACNFRPISRFAAVLIASQLSPSPTPALHCQLRLNSSPPRSPSLPHTLRPYYLPPCPYFRSIHPYPATAAGDPVQSHPGPSVHLCYRYQAAPYPRLLRRAPLFRKKKRERSRSRRRRAERVASSTALRPTGLRLHPLLAKGPLVAPLLPRSNSATTLTPINHPALLDSLSA